MYGIIINPMKYITQTNEYVWGVTRKEPNGSYKRYLAIEYIDRTDLDNINIIGSAVDFNAWLYEHGESEV